MDSIRKDNGKQDLYFNSMSESEISFNIFKVSINSSYEDEQFLKSSIPSLDFYKFKQYLKKISSLILETIKNRLK